MIRHGKRGFYSVRHCVEVALVYIDDASHVKSSERLHQVLILVEDVDIFLANLSVRIIVAAKLWQSDEEILQNSVC